MAGDETRVRGEFVAEIGQPAQVNLESQLVDDPQVVVETAHATGETSITYLSDPALTVAAAAPATLHGQLDSGQPVSLLAAQNHGWSGFPTRPHYDARTVVIGAHVDDDQRYNAVRFRIDHPRWLAHLVDGTEHTVPGDGSVLRAVASRDGTWLVYESAQPRALRELDRRVVSGCLALARLALDRPLRIRATEVRIDLKNGDWLELHSPGFRAPVTGYDVPLLGREELTIERFANWITFNERLDGLASAVAEPAQGTVQTQVLVVTSLVEGLHRRLLSYQQSRFPTATGGARERIKKAARTSAAQQADREEGIDREDVRVAVKDALSHFEDVGYRTRAQDIIDEVLGAVPELAESIPDLAGKLLAARNDIAHHLVLDDENELLSERFDRWAVVSYATPWLLRLLLLLRAGVSPEVLHRACLDYERFGFLRANLASIGRDLGWPRLLQG